MPICCACGKNWWIHIQKLDKLPLPQFLSHLSESDNVQMTVLFWVVLCINHKALISWLIVSGSTRYSGVCHFNLRLQETTSLDSKTTEVFRCLRPLLRPRFKSRLRQVGWENFWWYLFYICWVALREVTLAMTEVKTRELHQLSCIFEFLNFYRCTNSTVIVRANIITRGGGIFAEASYPLNDNYQIISVE